MRRVCTIIARNYWAQARVLARSLRAHHPDVPFTVLVIDPDEDTARRAEDESFDVIGPLDLGIERRELHRMAAIYDVLELATALKPWLLRHLLGDENAVVYLDPDIEVFTPIDDVWDLATEHGIVVTPHSTVPAAGDDGRPEDELTILGSGTYNLGFIAVGPDARAFLDWWAERLRRDGLIAKESAMFVDQRWVDLAPSYFGVHIVRDPEWNVAYWNLPARELTFEDGRHIVDGRPLRFFHYSGFNPDRPDELSCYESDPPRTRLEDHPVLAAMCRRYGDALIRAGYRAHSRLPYGFACTATGLPLDRYARRLVRRELLTAESNGTLEPPDPFEPRGARAFESWLREPVAAHRVTRYLKGIYDERADLQASFPDLASLDARMFVDWARVRARFEPNVAAELVGSSLGRRREPADDGVNVAGYVRAESGVGEVARLVVSALDAVRIPCAVVPFDRTASRQASPVLDDRLGPPASRPNIVCVNADQIPDFVAHGGRELIDDRRTIAVWQWEVERFPDWMAASAETVDEIWVASEHAAAAVRERVAKPVYVFPMPVVRPKASSRSRASLGLPEGFVFLFCFDFDSVFERKNPLGVVAAFSRAFPAGSGPQLVIKSVRGDAHPEDLAPLRGAAAERPDIHILDGYMDRADHVALVAACDAYVSLHRAEGFGLTMAEAMALGKPVIATGYSGNLEFMDETNSWLVPYELVAIPEGCDPYPIGARWAKPDVDAAAEMMRSIVADPLAANDRGRRAALDMARLHAPSLGGAFIRQRLNDDPSLLAAEHERREAEARRWRAFDSAGAALDGGPDVRSPTGYGPMSRLVRRIVLRVARHYIEHQEKIQTSLLDAVRDLELRLRAEADTARDLEREIDALHERLEHERRHSSDPGDRVETDPRVQRFAGLLTTGSPVIVVGADSATVAGDLEALGFDAAPLGEHDAGAILDAIETLDDRSLQTLLAVDLIDRLSVFDQERFLELVRRKLGPSGVLVAGLSAPTGADLVMERCRAAGFGSVRVVHADDDDAAGTVLAAERVQTSL